MKHILFTKELLLSAVALFAIIATSCIREDLDQCYTLKLKVENIKGDDITEYGLIYFRRESELLGET